MWKKVISWERVMRFLNGASWNTPSLVVIYPVGALNYNCCFKFPERLQKSKNKCSFGLPYSVGQNVRHRTKCSVSNFPLCLLTVLSLPGSWLPKHVEWWVGLGWSRGKELELVPRQLNWIAKLSFGQDAALVYSCRWILRLTSKIIYFPQLLGTYESH